MVLKFGAWIVDALQTYTQPVIIYLPPFGELRGGAWAVLDTQINPTCITMLADSNSRGGVLEANGIVEIKFREKDLSILLKKCDKKTAKLEEELLVLNKKGGGEENEEKKKRIQQEYEKRKEKILPVCRAAAVKFADLHDTTARMLEKGAIHVRKTKKKKEYGKRREKTKSSVFCLSSFSMFFFFCLTTA